MNKRGISPLIATVLLVSFVVILAAVIMFWGKQYVTELMEKRGDMAAIKNDCVISIKMDVLGVDTTNYAVNIRNTGTKKINGFMLKFDNGDSGQYNQIVQTYEDASISLGPYNPGGGAETVNIIPMLRPEGIGAPPVPCSTQNKIVRLT